MWDSVTLYTPHTLNERITKEPLQTTVLFSWQPFDGSIGIFHAKYTQCHRSCTLSWLCLFTVPTSVTNNMITTLYFNILAVFVQVLPYPLTFCGDLKQTYYDHSIVQEVFYIILHASITMFVKNTVIDSNHVQVSTCVLHLFTVCWARVSVEAWFPCTHAHVC